MSFLNQSNNNVNHATKRQRSGFHQSQYHIQIIPYMKFTIEKLHLIFNLIIVCSIFLSCIDKKKEIIEQEFKGSNIEFRELTLPEVFQLSQIENKLNSAAAICNCEPIKLIENAQSCQNSINIRQSIYIDSLIYFGSLENSNEEERINNEINLLKEKYSLVGEAQKLLWEIGLNHYSQNTHGLFVVDIKEKNETYICNLNLELEEVEYKLLLDE
ncbi:hypothetical protein [Marinigracilibium pacificum]|uniref:Uncharacterized protein n=1 Tax=Marinigracilibium pacificum TaxID=2729599 RepID=A0A848IU56_9BACT|nr:hypothetical protein [Marinigracilibium pacificum]NMM47266.1 hypothetical protein [Marinigracilibium pacificum]